MLGIMMAGLGEILSSFADTGKKALATTFSPEAIIIITRTSGIIVNITYLSFIGFPEVQWRAPFLPALALGMLGAAGEALFMYGCEAPTSHSPHRYSR